MKIIIEVLGGTGVPGLPEIKSALEPLKWKYALALLNVTLVE